MITIQRLVCLKTFNTPTCAVDVVWFVLENMLVEAILYNVMNNVMNSQLRANHNTVSNNGHVTIVVMINQWPCELKWPKVFPLEDSN